MSEHRYVNFKLCILFMLGVLLCATLFYEGTQYSNLINNYAVAFGREEGTHWLKKDGSNMEAYIEAMRSDIGSLQQDVKAIGAEQEKIQDILSKLVEGRIDSVLQNKPVHQEENSVATQQQQVSSSEGQSGSATQKEDAIVDPMKPDQEGIYHGFLSKKEPEFFRSLQNVIDEMDNHERCQRYGWTYNAANPKKRRLFLGNIMASEPWELFEVVGAETYNLFAGVVLVESNRTQTFSARKTLRLNHTDSFKRIFGIENVQVRPFVNENEEIKGLFREHLQRHEVLKGWKEIGMQKDDVGVMCDSDETFTRDFYRAVQVCDIDFLDYEKGRCKYDQTGIRGRGLTFEGSPECPRAIHEVFHPDMKLGHCIEEIGDTMLHPKAPREPGTFEVNRAYGYGSPGANSTIHLDAITDNRHPLSNGADFRKFGAFFWDKIDVNRYPQYSQYTAFHLHNFFTSPDAIRFKYSTYGHPREIDDKMTLGEVSGEVNIMVMCVRDEDDSMNKESVRRIPGGFKAVKPFRPIYFHDEEYRNYRHQALKGMINNDIKGTDSH